MKQYQIVLYVKAYSDTGKESDIVESAIESVEDGIIEGWDSAWEEGSVRMYVVGQDRDSKFYYVISSVTHGFLFSEALRAAGAGRRL